LISKNIKHERTKTEGRERLGGKAQEIALPQKKIASWGGKERGGRGFFREEGGPGGRRERVSGRGENEGL